jgi:hypothetical protein
MILKNILVIIVLLLLLPVLTVAQASRSTYVGYEYKGVAPETTLPNGVRHFGGGLIGDIDADPVYGISQVASGTTKMLWLEASTGRDASGVTGWKVKDVLSFTSLAKSDYVFFAEDPSIECKRKSEPIENLVGVGRIFQARGVFRPSKLWVANIKNEKFESISLANVVCSYSEP